MHFGEKMAERGGGEGREADGQRYPGFHLASLTLVETGG